MARTYRNRHAVPSGYVVRDGGGLFYSACCPTTRDQQDSWEKNWKFPSSKVCPCWDYPRFRSKWARKELKKYRKPYQRTYRARVRQAMHHAYRDDDWEHIPQWKRTCGWLTW